MRINTNYETIKYNDHRDYRGNSEYKKENKILKMNKYHSQKSSKGRRKIYIQELNNRFT